MPLADTYAASLFPVNVSRPAIRAHALTFVQAAALSHALNQDKADFYYSAWVSFVDALHGMLSGFYTWTTVKLYYSVFYSLRAALAANGICIFHVRNTACVIEAAAGKMPDLSRDAGTHKTVLRAFQRLYSQHPLQSQDIGIENPLDWLMRLREEANYINARFIEPSAPDGFAFVARRGVRTMINAYLEEATGLYVFDPDHAIVAFPLRALQLVGEGITTGGLLRPSEEEMKFIVSRARDESGSYSKLVHEMKRLL